MPWLHALAIALLASIRAASSLQVDDEDFHERLYIRPLPDGKVLSHFEFATTGSHARWEGLRVDEGIAGTRLLQFYRSHSSCRLSVIKLSVPDEPATSLPFSYHTLIRRRGGIPQPDSRSMGLYTMGRDCRRWIVIRRRDLRMVEQFRRGQ